MKPHLNISLFLMEHQSQLEKLSWALCYMGRWFEIQFVLANSSSFLFSSIRYTTLLYNLAFSYLVNKESSAGLSSFQFWHHLAFTFPQLTCRTYIILVAIWFIDARQRGGLKQYTLCQVGCWEKLISMRMLPSAHEWSTCILRCWELTKREDKPSRAELEAQIASVDSFFRIYNKTWGLSWDVLFSDDKGESTGLGVIWEMLQWKKKN